MTGLEEVLKRAATDLDAVGAKWAIIGGLAVATRAAPRFTQDVDFAVSVADDGGRRIRANLPDSWALTMADLVTVSAASTIPGCCCPATSPTGVSAAAHYCRWRTWA
jgi:hypothetical protein